MGHQPDVVAGAPILAAWHNIIRDRTVEWFTNAAERAAQWIAPPEGALSFLRDTDTLSYYNGSAWRGIAYGEQASAQMTANTGYFVATLSPIPALGTLTFACPGNRIYRVELDLMLEMNATVGGVLTIMQDGAQLTQRNYYAVASPQTLGIHIAARATPAAGSHSWTVSGNTTAAGTNVRVLAAATYPSLFTLTDMGPVTP